MLLAAEAYFNERQCCTLISWCTMHTHTYTLSLSLSLSLSHTHTHTHIHTHIHTHSAAPAPASSIPDNLATAPSLGQSRAKLLKKHPLLYPVLEGLAIYTHLISVEYFNDIMDVFHQVGRCPTSSQLPAQMCDVLRHLFSLCTLHVRCLYVLSCAVCRVGHNRAYKHVYG